MIMEYINYIVENGIRQVIEQEVVSGGFRPVVVHYTYEGQLVIETIYYRNPSTDAGWASEKQQRTYELQQAQGFNTIEL
jgi:hypothetical protein